MKDLQPTYPVPGKNESGSASKKLVGIKNFWLGFLTACTILLGLSIMYVLFCPHYINSRIIIEQKSEKEKKNGRSLREVPQERPLLKFTL